MALPFLKSKVRATPMVDVQKRKPDQEDDMSGSAPLEAAAQDICNAIEQKDYTHLALALRAAFQILDAEPHQEGPHTNEEDSE